MAEIMNAVVKEKPELGAEFRQVKLPELKPEWVMVKVKACSICGTDVHIYKWDPWSDNRIGAKNLPQTLGHEVAGEVVEVGSHVSRIKVGDYISAETHIYDPSDITALVGQFHIGENMKILGVDCDGSFAEYFAVHQSVCWVNDTSIPPEFATIQEPMGNATYAVLGEDNDIAGKSMVFIGDGPIALFGIGVARACGAANIFVVGLSEYGLQIAKKMGADHILYADGRDGKDLQKRVEYIKDNTYGAGADIVLDMVGALPAIQEGFKYLRKGGRFTAFGIAPKDEVPIDYNNSIVFKGAQIHGINGRKIFDTWYRVRNLLTMKRVDVAPVITHLFELKDFKKGFDLLLAEPRLCSKIVLFPDTEEFQKAVKRLEERIK
ncbi:alcohol dehydrogenase catalytic domain-containing protein [bacterium]|nr:alcohol dehydrogenase catalytic domain-containing protein [bacterium]